jgi:hypothetical protein
MLRVLMHELSCNGPAAGAGLALQTGGGGAVQRMALYTTHIPQDALKYQVVEVRTLFNEIGANASGPSSRVRTSSMPGRSRGWKSFASLRRVSRRVGRGDNRCAPPKRLSPER